MFNSTPMPLSMSLIVNPLSVITEIPFFPSSFSNKPRSTSEIEPTYRGEMKDIAPLGVVFSQCYDSCSCSRLMTGDGGHLVSPVASMMA